ncbi:MAG: glutamate racemase [Firmicutes bacterium]|nr:glutamate racemase [Bacillota bacterium]
MDDRPIGVFDSGIGGLSCVAPLKKLLPGEKILFFGDTARVPYGSKSDATIISYSLQIADYLAGQGAKALVIACNTISAVAIGAIRGAYPDIPVVGIVEPAARRTAELLRGGKKAGLIATRATVNNGAYRKAVKALLPGSELPAMACPLFVPIVEEGLADSDIARLTASHYLDVFVRDNGLDTLVLGCTHYPFLADTLRSVFPELDLVDPAECLAEEAARVLDEKDLLAEPGANADKPDVFYASAISGAFTETVDAVTGGADYDILQHHF